MKKQTKMACLILAFAAVLCSCKKDENKSLKDKEPIEAEVKKTDVKRTVTVPELKTYLSVLINADTAILKYDEKREVFTLLGIDQFTKANLTEVYLNNTKN